MFFKKKLEKVAVVSLDGVPYTFLEYAFKNDIMPFLASLAKEGSFLRMNSVYPTISSVAWSSFITGVNPAKHRIFGFVDRIPTPFKVFIPTGNHRGVKTLPEIISEKGKHVIVMNVPVTYPPFRVNGVLVSGFLATNIEKATYPQSVAKVLKELNYIIDVDPWEAKDNKEEFLKDLYRALETRFKVANHFMKKEKWDFFMVHIMETDRINHFFWPEKFGDPYPQNLLDFYKEVDRQFELFAKDLPKEVHLFSLSDHGFCPIIQEVFVNHWLFENGYLKFKNVPPKDFSDIDPQSAAYSLIPGRIFINLKRREEFGSVEQGESYERLRDEISKAIFDMEDPETGNQIIDKVFKREEIYSGPYLDEAADLIVHPKDGYDLKGNLYTQSLVGRSHLIGMHTYDDAYLITPLRLNPGDREISILDVPPTILDALKVMVPGLDGRSLM